MKTCTEHDDLDKETCRRCEVFDICMVGKQLIVYSPSQDYEIENLITKMAIELVELKHEVKKLKKELQEQACDKVLY